MCNRDLGVLPWWSSGSQRGIEMTSHRIRLWGLAAPALIMLAACGGGTTAGQVRGLEGPATDVSVSVAPSASTSVEGPTSPSASAPTAHTLADAPMSKDASPTPNAEWAQAAPRAQAPDRQAAAAPGLPVTGGLILGDGCRIEPYTQCTYANLYSAWLAGANLSGAYLDHAHLAGATLTDANLSYAHLSAADLRQADLRRADITRADILFADLTGANLIGAKLHFSARDRANFSGATWIDGRKCAAESIGGCR